MKKERLAIYTCVFLSFTGFFSCNKELESVVQDSEPVSERQELKEFRATIGKFVSEDALSPTTRTTIVTDENEDLQLVWAENDTIGIFPASGNQVAFPMSSSAGSKTAKFDGGGWGLKSESTYSAYYPLIGQFYLDQKNIPLIMSAQTQDGNGSYAHIGKSDYMAAVNATVNEDGGVDFQFSPLTCLIHMQLKMPARANYTYVALETSGVFNTEALLNLTTGEVTPTKSSPLQVLSLKNVDLTGGEDNPILEVYFSILPVDLSNNVIYVKIFDEDYNCYTATLTAKTFVAGTIYNYKKVATADLTHTGLPVVILNTPENVDIVSKDDYVPNTLLSILQTDIMDEFCELTNVKGRGNSTWNAPKKPYAIKFDKKKSLLSMPEDKSWVLLANYYDPTLLRNDLALYISSEYTSLAWTPRYTHVDLILNGAYKGIYQLGEKVKIAKKRVNIDDGILMEIDARATSEEDARYFTISHLEQAVNIKDPDVEYNDDNYNYAKDFVTVADAALFSDDFADPENGWQKYMDINSFVDWYLVNEISKNADSRFVSSCYMNLKRDGKLKMGPVWDFDIAFGNYVFMDIETQNALNSTEGYRVKQTQWYTRLFEDPAFVARVKERFNEIYASKEQILGHINEKSIVLKSKVVEDNMLWGKVCNTGSTNETVQAEYQTKVNALKSWVESRLNWLKSQFDAM